MEVKIWDDVVVLDHGEGLRQESKDGAVSQVVSNKQGLFMAMVQNQKTVWRYDESHIIESRIVIGM